MNEESQIEPTIELVGEAAVDMTDEVIDLSTLAEEDIKLGNLLKISPSE